MFIVGIFVTYGNFFFLQHVRLNWWNTVENEPGTLASGMAFWWKIRLCNLNRKVFFFSRHLGRERERKEKHKWCRIIIWKIKDNFKVDSQKLKEEMVTFWIFRDAVNYFPNFINLKNLLYVLKSGSVFALLYFLYSIL